MAPSDYHLFRLTHLRTHLSSYEEVQKWVNEWIASKDTAFYRHGIALLLEKWEKVENGGNYFD